MLAEPTDWELQFDMTAPQYNQTKERRFPVEILEEDPALRPDGVNRSTTTKTVVWIELTSPWEDSMTLRHLTTYASYACLPYALWAVMGGQYDIAALRETHHHTQLKIDHESNGCTSCVLR